MPVLHLGVVEFPYSASHGTTTGDVAEILEAKYAIMETFVETLGREAITKSLERSVKNAVENVLMGSNSAAFTMTAEAEGEIEAAFDIFLTQQDMDGRIAGVPTRAALAGISHRFKHPYAKSNPERPSFVDTGLYLYSFTVWTDE